MTQLTVPELVESVKECLLGSVGRLETTDEKSWFSFVHGTARIVVEIGPLPVNQVPVVRIWSLTNGGVPPSPELFQTLAMIDAPLGGARAILDDDGTADVTFGYSLPYLSSFDEEQFLMAVQLVADAADEVDDYLQARFGGKVAHDPLAADTAPGQA